MFSDLGEWKIELLYCDDNYIEQKKYLKKVLSGMKYLQNNIIIERLYLYYFVKNKQYIIIERSKVFCIFIELLKEWKEVKWDESMCKIYLSLIKGFDKIKNINNCNDIIIQDYMIELKKKFLEFELYEYCNEIDKLKKKYEIKNEGI